MSFVCCYISPFILSFSLPPESLVFLYALRRYIADTIAWSKEALEPLLFQGVITHTGCIYSNRGAKVGVEKKRRGSALGEWLLESATQTLQGRPWRGQRCCTDARLCLLRKTAHSCKLDLSMKDIIARKKNLHVCLVLLPPTSEVVLLKAGEMAQW